MKFLLTSGGISNTSIRNVLVDVLGKPIAESPALKASTGESTSSSGQYTTTRPSSAALARGDDSGYVTC